MENAISLIKRFEGLSLSAYRCPAGVWTIGWGHTKNVRPLMSVSHAEADELLRNDVSEIFTKLTQLSAEANVTLSSNQLSALTSFIFNVGFSAFRRSTLWKLIRENPDNPDIARQFAKWKYAAGKVMSGLVRRRREEATLYFK
ncbi:MAG: lysozyme [Bacteroidales bacterium]|nr:lysozyme [Bacteroidales bacterium]